MSEDLFFTTKSESAESADKKTTLLIFTLQNNRYYALPSGNVKEILRDCKIFPLPFAPAFLKGLVNRYGEPYAVIDPAIMMGENEQKTSIYIAINDENHACFQICDVKDFFTVAKNKVIPFASSENADFNSDFFEGTVAFKDKSVLVLNIAAFLQKAEQDIAAR